MADERALEQQEEAAFAAAAWGVLARLLTEPPGEEVLAALASLGDALGVEGRVDPMDVSRDDSDALLLSPGGANLCPWESVWRPAPDRPVAVPSRKQRGHLLGPVAIDAGRRYGEAGVTLAATTLLPDHLGVEVAFLAALAGREADAAARQASGEADAARATARGFLHEHVGAWLPLFAGELQGRAITDTWRLAGAVLARHLDDERQRLGA